MSQTKFENVDYELALKYLVKIGSNSHIKDLGLEQVAPRWKGSRQGLNEKDKWTNCGRELLDFPKIKILGQVVETAVLVCMGTGDPPIMLWEQVVPSTRGGSHRNEVYCQFG